MAVVTEYKFSSDGTDTAADVSTAKVGGTNIDVGVMSFPIAESQPFRNALDQAEADDGTDGVFESEYTLAATGFEFGVSRDGAGSITTIDMPGGQSWSIEKARDFVSVL